MSLPKATSISFPQRAATDAAGTPRAAIRRCAGSLVLVVLALSAGCTSILSPISGVPAHRVPPQFLERPKANWEPISLARLRQEPPRQYLLDSGDILGIYIEGVLGTAEEPPPVHFPDKDSDLPPSIGFPMPVREDGTLSLPLVPPLNVRGLTLTQVENLIRKAYTVDRQILQPGRDRIIATLIEKRTVQVIVVREDKGGGLNLNQLGGQGGRGGGLFRGADQSGEGHVIKLPAYKNDVLNALAETGGLPGLNAKNEVKILKGRLADAKKRDAFVQQFYAQYAGQPCICPPPLPDDPSIIRIPLRLPPGAVPTFQPIDVVLEEGDIVYVEAREAEVFYTGGLLPGGEYPLPRDYDLDVLGALAIAGQGALGMQGGGGGGVGGLVGGIGGVPPGQLFILRKTPCNGQIIISVDLNRAIQDPAARPLVQAGDTLILRYKPQEELVNFGIGTFFTYGISELLRGGD